MKVLQVIKTAYRATIEEQDDTIVWLTHAMKGAGAELDVLLTGNAVNYAVTAQSAEGLAFGEWQQTQPPRIARDIGGLIEKGVSVFVADEDIAELGIGEAGLVEGIQRVSGEEIAKLYNGYDQVWQW